MSKIKILLPFLLLLSFGFVFYSFENTGLFQAVTTNFNLTINPPSTFEPVTPPDPDPIVVPGGGGGGGGGGASSSRSTPKSTSRTEVLEDDTKTSEDDKKTSEDDKTTQDKPSTYDPDGDYVPPQDTDYQAPDNTLKRVLTPEEILMYRQIYRGSGDSFFINLLDLSGGYLKPLVLKGKTNIANAVVFIRFIEEGVTYMAEVNRDGVFNFEIPELFKRGTHTVEVKALDPFDFSVKSSTIYTLHFEAFTLLDEDQIAEDVTVESPTNELGPSTDGIDETDGMGETDGIEETGETAEEIEETQDIPAETTYIEDISSTEGFIDFHLINEANAEEDQVVSTEELKKYFYINLEVPETVNASEILEFRIKVADMTEQTISGSTLIQVNYNIKNLATNKIEFEKSEVHEIEEGLIYPVQLKVFDLLENNYYAVNVSIVDENFQRFKAREIFEVIPLEEVKGQSNDNDSSEFGDAKNNIYIILTLVMVLVLGVVIIYQINRD
ncbi:hypothetical protein GF354_01640 [Candidatus Peregrinibacteria bacterium]|nr:hypothetical protein [Candidatus Peregrinibacteria bacterium]